MLEITIPAREAYDERSGEFITFEGQTLRLEHSLLSLSKWESKWHKAFFSKKEKTLEETIDYIKCMTLTKNVNPNAYLFLTDDNVQRINAYIEDPMTATTFYDSSQGKSSNETVTSELIYYWMVTLNIPWECEKWHINRLLTLVRICNIKQQPNKKMSRGEVMKRNKALNEARRKKFNSKG